MAKSRLTGVKSTRRLLRNIPATMHAEMGHVMQDAGPKIARQMQSRTPQKTGALRAGIKWKVLPRTLKLQVGLLGTKRGRAKLFYGYILNFGRKAQIKRVTKKAAMARWSARLSQSARIPKDPTYTIRVSRIAPMHFVTGAMPDLRNTLRGKLQGIWNRVLKKAAAGTGNE